jgi:hypothetical protein
MKLYIIKKPFFWSSKQVQTVCYESFLAEDPRDPIQVFPKIIQCEAALKEFVAGFKQHNAQVQIGYKDLTIKKD